MHFSQSLTGRTGSFLCIKREIGAGNLVHSLSTFTAIHIDVEIRIDLLRLFPAVCRRNNPAAVRAGTHPQLLIDHPQVRIYIRLGSHRRTGISVSIRLGNQDGRGSSLNVLYIWLVDSLQRDCLEILPLTFLKQNIDQQSRLARAGKPRKYNQFIFGYLERNIFQIAFVRTSNSDITHVIPPLLPFCRTPHIHFQVT